ncbi:MAG: tRNA pseudouridine(13) synthase TruD [Candidatus Bathyarchaeota archaeon]|nr:tRNA pseudouridine(13) synthase TruD [Candidatus Bathyarchaeota archaeon]
MQVPELEKQLGMEVYATQPDGFGGKIRQLLDDFVVEEVLVDGSLAQVTPPVDAWEPVGEGHYLIAVLVKRRWDTFFAVKEVAKRLHISQKRIRFAGIKDTKALTGQHISLQNVSADQVLEASIKDIILYPKHFSKERMYSQLIQGNRFHLTIRNIDHSIDEITEQAQQTKQEIEAVGGVPNFFGHQRFGTIRPNTHLVGKYLTLNDAQKAAQAFLGEPSIHEHPEAQKARQHLQDTNDFQAAIENFPRFLKYERFMLHHLVKYPNDFVGAFRTLPRRLRKLFVQGYQSYLFNRFLSERIRQQIPLHEPQVGDYALKLDAYGLPTEEYEQVTEANLQTLSVAINEGKMCVGAPLVGPNQPPSMGVQGEIEQKILKEENVNPDDFKISFMPEATAEGKVRAMLNPAKDLALEEISEDSENSGKQMIKLGFTLNRGSYATVFLREFMKPQNLIESGY